MKKLVLTVFAVAALAATPAIAADMPVKAAAYKAPVVAPLAFSWTGFYIGVHGGGDWFNKDWSVPNTPINVAGVCAIAGCNYSVGGHTAHSWLAGGQVGFNYQVSSWVLGIEAQASWTRLEGTNLDPPPVIAAFGFANHSRTDSLGTIAGRLGMAWDRTLLYVKGGGAWAHDKFWVSTNLNPVALQSLTDNRWGWMGGVGVEYAFTQNWSVKVEYDYLDFGTRRETLPCAAGAVGCGGSFEYDVKQTIQLVKAGINYRFGGPVRAAY